MVLGVSSRALLGACEQLGLDVDTLLAAAGIDRRALDDPDARLPGERVAALWREVLDGPHVDARCPRVADHRAVIEPRNMSIAQW